MQEDSKKTEPTPSGKKVVKTYAGDMAQIIESSPGGMIKKIIHEEEENETEKRNLSPESRKNKIFTAFGIVFSFLALALLYYFISTKDVPTLSVERQFVPLIFNDKSDFIEVANLDKDEIVTSVLNKVNTETVKVGGVEGIYLSYNKKVVGLRKFIELIKGNFTPGDANLVKDNFLMGVVNGKTKDFFILLKVRSITDIFDNLQSWERKMFIDLHGFFGINITPDINYLLIKNFEDGVVENKNARILYQNGDGEEKIAIMYIFADDTSVIITSTKNAAHEIMLRLSGSKVEK